MPLGSCCPGTHSLGDFTPKDDQEKEDDRHPDSGYSRDSPSIEQVGECGPDKHQKECDDEFGRFFQVLPEIARSRLLITLLLDLGGVSNHSGLGHGKLDDAKANQFLNQVDAFGI